MKRKAVLALVLAVCMIATLAFSACRGGGSDDKVTMTFYDSDGTTVLGTKEYDKGEAPVKPEDPTKEGFTFLGWFVTPTNPNEFDFTEVLNEDGSAYAKWATANYVDERTWVITGNGAYDPLKTNNWGAATDMAPYTMTKQSANVFTITLDLYENDQFKFTVLNNDGTLDYDNDDGADVGFAQLTNPEFKFEGVVAFGDASADIKVITSGNYTFTLTTDPVNTNNTITMVRNGDATDVEEVQLVTYSIKGSVVTGWQNKTEGDEYLMTENNGVYTLEIQLFANDEFMFIGLVEEDGVIKTADTITIKGTQLDVDASTTNISSAPNGNFITAQNGTYTFEYTASTDKIVVTYSEEFTAERVIPTTWYILGNGSVTGSVLKTAAWGLNDEDAQALTADAVKELTYTITLDLFENDEFQICSDSSWANKHHFDHLVDPVVADVTYFAKGGNITVKVSGNYTLTLTLDPDDAALDTITWVRNGDTTIEQDDDLEAIDVYIKGSFGGVSQWTTPGPDYKFTLTEDAGIFNFVFDFVVGDNFGFVVYPKDSLEGYGTWKGADKIADAVSANNADFASAGNFSASESGTYLVTYNQSEDTFTFTLANEEAYVKGNAIEGWGNKPESGKMTLTSEGKFEITLTVAVNDELMIQHFPKGVPSQWGTAFASSKVIAGGASENFDLTANNIKCLVAGTYKIVFSSADGISITAVE